MRVTEKQINNQMRIELCPGGERSDGIKIRYNWEVQRKFAKENELMLESSQGRMGTSGKGLSNAKICK